MHPKRHDRSDKRSPRLWCMLFPKWGLQRWSEHPRAVTIIGHKTTGVCWHFSIRTTESWIGATPSKKWITKEKWGFVDTSRFAQSKNWVRASPSKGDSKRGINQQKKGLYWPDGSFCFPYGVGMKELSKEMNLISSYQRELFKSWSSTTDWNATQTKNREGLPRSTTRVHVVCALLRGQGQKGELLPIKKAVLTRWRCLKFVPTETI